jgi:hypothetical protein
MKVYFKVPSLSDTLLALEGFEGNSISSLKSALKESIKPALQIPISNLDLKMGDSIITEEILNNSDLKTILEEARVSIANPIILIPTFTYLDHCIFCFCFSLGGFLAGFLDIGNSGNEDGRPFFVLWFIYGLFEISCSLYILIILCTLAGKQQISSQLWCVFLGFCAHSVAELYSLRGDLSLSYEYKSYP